ncbi:hypothetical protein LIER_41259 [Lithospermum erythrorhizon]|uniref:Uncharacterized protein n=1 Tax=Lithospermum erythrorhizon TaxID=34254 RepID=A0AAV3R6I6_LITER
MGERVPRIWTPLSKAKLPKFTKSAQVKAQIALLQGVFPESWDYKVFCEEGVLIHASIIRSKEFDCKRANEAEQKALLAQESVGRAVEEYRTSEAYQEDLGMEAAYCLSLFVKTFKDASPSMVAHYQEYTSGYPSHWFTSLDINAHLSPMEGEEGGVNPEAQDPKLSFF